MIAAGVAAALAVAATLVTLPALLDRDDRYPFRGHESA
jgi:hypothetical protein